MISTSYELRVTSYEVRSVIGTELDLCVLAFQHRVGVLAVLGAMLVGSVALGQTLSIRVDLDLRTGGALSGVMVDHTSHGIVVMHDTTPYVFSWDEIEADSAYVARRDLRVFDRGGLEKFTAEDHFQIGLYALSRSLPKRAATAFAGAQQLDRSYKPRVREAFVQYNERKRQKREGGGQDKALVETQKGRNEDTQKHDNSGDAHRGSLETTVREVTAGEGLSPETRERVLTVYKSFGETVRREICDDLTLIETDHFLVFTDWTKGNRVMLGKWCEAMYEALCAQFSFDASEAVFLAKCPVFCWRSKTRFMEFARRFDGYDGTNAIGYTRSMADSGHVHMVLLRQGRSEADFDRFAGTLVHEGTHGFLHRLPLVGESLTAPPRLIPHWVNEGYADLVAERVLGDRCPNGENAALLARQYVRYDWPITDLLENDGPIDVHQYALAHSVVMYLEGLGRGRFASFIRSLKAGRATNEALAAEYDGMTLNQLESRWRSAIRAAEPPGVRTADDPTYQKEAS